jgi:hypothetical protein
MKLTKLITYLIIGAPAILLPLFIWFMVTEPEGAPVVRVDLADTQPIRIELDPAPPLDTFSSPVPIITDKPIRKPSRPRLVESNKKNDTDAGTDIVPVPVEPYPPVSPAEDERLARERRERLEWLESAIGNTPQ